MARCTYCGAEIRNHARYCPSCGASVPPAGYRNPPVELPPRQFPALLLVLVLLLGVTGVSLHLIGSLRSDDTNSQSYSLSTAPIAGQAPAATAAPTESVPDITQLQPLWNGDWYGWWIMTNTTGAFTELEGNWWDCMAQIRLSDSGKCTMVMWDVDYTKKDPAANITFRISPELGTGPMGGAVSENGYFLAMDVEQGMLAMDPAIYGVENFIGLEGDYADEEGTFTFLVYLRPWGQRWEDLETGSYANIPFAPQDMLPFNYEDWYLPLINAGKPMPSSFS